MPSALSVSLARSGRCAPSSETFVDSLDRTVDVALAPLRDHPVPDAISSLASALGDHGLVWFLLALTRVWRPGRRRAVALRALVFTGALTPLVNAGLKTAVGRVRPEGHAADSLPVRIPRSTSFPSGHALTAWCAATLLSDDDAWSPAYYGIAAAISVSRVHVHLHHASDVLAGSILGIVLGRLGRLMFPVR
jgi:undecaprenyl-diphosphatase